MRMNSIKEMELQAAYMPLTPNKFYMWSISFPNETAKSSQDFFKCDLS